MLNYTDKLLCFFLMGSSLFSLEAIQPYDTDINMYQQAIIFDWQVADNYYCKKIPTETFLDFLAVYQKQPIQENQLGMRSQGSFFLWHLLKEINPTLVLESSVYGKNNVWIINEAVPSAKVKVVSENFSFLTVDEDSKESTVCFFNDHENAFDRVLQAHEKGLKHLIFNDNYRPGYNECGQSYLSLRECLELEEHKEKAVILNKIIKRYLIMPQIIGTAIYASLSLAQAPAIWRSLDELDVSLRDQMKIFYDDLPFYRWITYVELH